MHLERIKIPGYRVLSNVDMLFEKDYEPQVFPIGSENGGGKSTLLQLIFVLLHCSAKPERHKYIQNTLASFSHSSSESEKLIAEFTLRVNGKKRQIRFISLGPKFISDSLGSDAENIDFNSFAKIYLHEPIMVGSKPGAKIIDSKKRIEHLLAAKNLTYLTWYVPLDSDVEETRIVICQKSLDDPEDIGGLLRVAEKSVFLLGPSNQQYLFLPRTTRKQMVKVEKKDLARLNSQKQLVKTASDLPGLYTYDWLSVEPMIKLFKNARDRDFSLAVETGKYGDNYTLMFQEVNNLLFGKQVRPFGDLSGIQFSVCNSDGEEVSIGLEDFSRGELKRIMIYAWLKANEAEHAVVLMDEIEVSFHPDWQYGIVRDLTDWAPGNQYLLATHSHELCQALTPAHVRELEPKLTNRGDLVEEDRT